MDVLLSLVVPALIVLIGIVGFGFVLSRLYKRAEKDKAYVRTGLRGQKVVLDGGALVLPIFQNIAWVNLRTLRLEVRRQNEEAMITKDKLRVDIGVEFYVRVKPDTSSIALAAQTLGDRTNDASQLRELVEAKFVDALRAVAATMDLAELQEQRAQFVKSVQETVASDLMLNGLELESASLTKLDQTDMKYFNENNAFDAEGLAKLTLITETKKRERNEIVRTTEVAIAEQNLAATQQTLELDRKGAEAKLNQERDIVNKTAATRAEKAKADAEARQAEENAGIAANLAIQQSAISAKRTAETAEIAKQRDVAIAAQEREIAVATKSREESEARAQAEKARAEAVAATEGVETARTVAIAERERQVAVIEARQEAEQEATRVVVAADAEKKAAADKAEAIRTAAQAEADAVKIKADAKQSEYAVEAEGQAKINDARNKLSPHIIEFELQTARIRAIPLALAEAVRPLEKIGEVRIIDMGGGLPGRVAAGAGGGAGGMTDNLMGQLLAYTANKPVIEKLLQEAGFKGGNNPVDALLNTVSAPQSSSSETGAANAAAEAGADHAAPAETAGSTRV